MPNFTYGLYPFAWTVEGSTGYHAPPAGSACVLDLRNETQQATQGQSAGYGLFAWSESPPNDLISLGTGYASTLQIDNAARSELQTRLGLSGPPAGATLADAMASVLGELADPTGTSGPRPIMPGRNGTLELHLAGRSRIWSQRVDGDEVLSASPRGRANRIREVIRAKLTAADSVGGKRLLQKVLSAELLKLGLTREEVAEGAPGKAAQWRRLLSSALRAKHGDARPERPTTSFSESFDGPDSATLGVDLAWTELSNSHLTSPDYWSNVSNTGRCNHTVDAYARAGAAAVSSDDHVVQATLVTCADGAGNCQGGPIARMATGSVTGYCFRVVRFFSPDWQDLCKIVAGTITSLSTYNADVTLPLVLAVDCDGSTIVGRSGGVARATVTDTSIATGRVGGLYGYNTPVDLDDWSIDDGLSGGGGASGSTAGLMGV